MDVRISGGNVKRVAFWSILVDGDVSTVDEVCSTNNVTLMR
jgi:hypothetical protein